jgi:[ribosomal protein S18]-alanine N-acetyltransferase
MVAVRPGTAADLPHLMAIARHSATAAQWSRAEYENLVSSDTHREFLVVVEDGGVCGFIVGREAAQEWEIENVAVSGSARRRGLGSRLLGEFLNRVRARGGAEVYLEVRESNLAARKLYEKRGFVETGRRKSYYHDPPEDALLLRFSFPQPG